jgi:uncharacterized OB-fold protein
VATPVAEGLFGDDGLLGGECARCHRRHFPRAEGCPWCGSQHVSPVTLSTAGTLWAWTAVNAPPPGYEGGVPYGFGVVELPDDGLRVISRLTEADPTHLAAGTPMRFVVVDLPSGVSTWAFEPADDGRALG